MLDSTTIVAALPVTTSDSLRLTFWNPSSDVSYNCYLRYLLKLKDGSLMQGSELLAVTAPAAAQEFRMRLTDGELLWCSVDCGASNVQEGSLFVAIALQSGDVDQASNLIQLTSGYVATGKPVNYPLSEPQAANAGAPSNGAENIPDPAAGSDFTWSAPTNTFTRITHLLAFLDTTGGGSTVTPELRISDTNGTILRSIATGASVGAATNNCFQLWRGELPTTLPARVFNWPFPDIGWVRDQTLVIESALLDPSDFWFDITIGYDMLTAN